MKKFLTRALPLCLALLIFVGSLAVPAFAAENETYTIDGVWRVKRFVEADLPVVDYPILVDLIYDNKNITALDLTNYLKFMVGDQPLGSVITFVDRDFTVNNPFTLNAAEFELWNICFYRVDSLAVLENPNADSIFTVFAGISGWIVTAIGDLMPMFYTETTGLTFVGTLAVAALAFAVIFLVIAIIRRFMHFGG